MAVNIDQLREGLKTYQESLSLHRRNLQDDFQQLHELFMRLSATYEGEAATTFKQSWMATEDWFQTYIIETQELSKYLQERIIALDKERQV